MNIKESSREHILADALTSMQLIGLAIGNHLAVLLLKHLTKFEIPQKLRLGTLVKSIF